MSSNIEKVGPAMKSTAKPWDFAKRKRAEKRGKEPPSYAKAANKRFRDEMHYAAFDTNKGSAIYPKIT